MDKYARYRERHPERVKENDRKYIEKNRESRNAKKREEYMRDRDNILEKNRTDLKQCLQRNNLPPDLLCKVVQKKD
jgi:hypothetical protein